MLCIDEVGKTFSQNISFIILPRYLTFLIRLQILILYLFFLSDCYSQGWITQKPPYASTVSYVLMHSFFPLWAESGGIFC